MAMKFSDKQTLEQLAGRCVGLLRSMAEDPCRARENTQVFFETEYVALYALLQDLAFNDDGQINWLLPTAMMMHNRVDVYKSDLGIVVTYGQDVIVEVASRLEAKCIVSGVTVYDKPSVIREKEGKVVRLPTHIIQVISDSRSVMRD